MYLFEKSRADDPGMMVALMLPSDVAEKLAQPEGEPASEMHLTLAYPGRMSELPSDAIKRVVAAVQQVCARHAPLEGVVGGLGRFNASESSDGKDVLYASYDSPGLPKLREAVFDAMVTAGAPPKATHGFSPHITLAYFSEGDDFPVQRIDTAPCRFDEVCVVVGDEIVGRAELGRKQEHRRAPGGKMKKLLNSLNKLGELLGRT